jgi:hypothetical protein
VLRNILHLLLDLPTDEIATSNGKNRHFQFFLCLLFVCCDVGVRLSVYRVLGSCCFKKGISPTNVEDTAQAPWLRSAPNVLFDGVVIDTGRIISFTLNVPVKL